MHERPLVAGHGAAQLGVEREPQAVAGHGLVHRGVPGGERHAGRLVEHLPVREVLEPRTADLHRRAQQTRRAAAGHGLERLLAARLVDHLAVQLHRAAALVARRLLQRGQDRPRPFELLRRRGEGGVDHLQLARVHRPLAVVSERAHTLGPFAQAVLVADGEIGAVDRLESGRAGRHEHRVLGVEPQLRAVGVGRPPERRGQVGIAEDQRLEPRRRGGDLPGASSPRAVSTSACTPTARRPRRASRAARPRGSRPPGPRPSERPASRSGLRRAPPAGSRRRRTTGSRSRSPAPPPASPASHRARASPATSSRASALAPAPPSPRGRSPARRPRGWPPWRASPRTIRAPTGRIAGLSLANINGAHAARQQFVHLGRGAAGTLLRACLRSR